MAKTEAKAGDTKLEQKHRGTHDELEAIKLILLANKPLLNRVLDKIRSQRAASVNKAGVEPATLKR